MTDSYTDDFNANVSESIDDKPRKTCNDGDSKSAVMLQLQQNIHNLKMRMPCGVKSIDDAHEERLKRLEQLLVDLYPKQLAAYARHLARFGITLDSVFRYKPLNLGGIRQVSKT